MTEIGKGFKEKHEGSTRTKALYWINQDGENVKIKIQFSVRKSGVSGTGRGYMAFALINDNAEVVWKYDKGFTVGADSIDGHNDNDSEVEFTIYHDKWENIFGTAFYLDSTSDSIGLPRSLPEFKEAFKNIFKDIIDIVGVFKALPIGEIQEVAGWSFSKLK